MVPVNDTKGCAPYRKVLRPMLDTNNIQSLEPFVYINKLAFCATIGVDLKKIAIKKKFSKSCFMHIGYPKHIVGTNVVKIESVAWTTTYVANTFWAQGRTIDQNRYFHQTQNRVFYDRCIFSSLL